MDSANALIFLCGSRLPRFGQVSGRLREPLFHLSCFISRHWLMHCPFLFGLLLASPLRRGVHCQYETHRISSLSISYTSLNFQALLLSFLSQLVAGALEPSTRA